MNYQQALDWIHSKLTFGIKPGLERMTWMLERLGNPQQRIKAVHVVGTNGKGSTVNYLQTIFSLAGYEVGTFTSPYIMDFRERISVNGQMISQEDLLALVELVYPVVEAMPLETDLEPATEFEVITLIMFLYFGQLHPVDIAFIEAGLGGLYDSTNLFQALAVVCPSIGLDHQAILGQTHAQIAQQKAGVLKAGEPLVYATDLDQVVQVFEARAEASSSPTFAYGRDFSMENSRAGLRFSSGEVTVDGISLAMPGQHQVANAALAIQTCLLLQDKYPRVTDQVIRQGLSQAKWLGRSEWLRPNLMIDGAHNNESVQALVDLLRTDYADRKIDILFAAIDTKPVATMLELLSQVGQVTVTSFPYPNSLKLEAYPETYPRVADFASWLDQDREDDTILVITGSLYFISQVRKGLCQD